MIVSNVIPFAGPAGPEKLENIDAEAAILGAVLIDNRLFDELTLRQADFFEPLHGRLYAKAAQIYASDGTCTAMTLAPHFAGDDALTSIGGRTYLARLTADGQGLLAPQALAAQIRDLAIRRRLRDGLRGVLDDCENLDKPAESLFAAAGEVTAAEDLASHAATFPLLDIAELEAMPPARWLVHETISEEGLSIIYGEPGAGKSFVVLDMALRVSMGLDWHGTRTRQAGVLYIAGEGARGIGKRIAGWRLHHGLDTSQARFALLPVAVQFMEDADLSRLIHTIDEAVRKLDFPIGMIVIDTVSRAIAGVDENGQEAMSSFVRACDRVKDHIGGAVIGVHHSGKDKERGMRGSSVLLGACDAAIRLTKSERIITLACEKQKDAEEFRPLYMELQPVEWTDGNTNEYGDAHTTLVPIRAEKPSDSQLGSDIIARAFGMMADAWTEGKPLSSKVQSRDSGRYAPSVFARQLGGDAEAWKTHITAWLETGCIAYEIFDRRTKTYGLRVISPIV